jgi:hypothetical protein
MFVNDEEVFEEVCGNFMDVGQCVEKFLEDDALFCEVFVILTGEVALLGGGEQG